ncbi:MAG: hypothetical protein ABSC53_13470 [Bacteroidota bacterium]
MESLPGVIENFIIKCFNSFSLISLFSFQQLTTQIRSADHNDSTKRSQRKICTQAGLRAIFLFVVIGTTALGQTQVFLDNFNRATIISGAPTTYSITVTAGDGDTSINTGSFLELTNDASATANGDGIVYVSGLTQDFLGTYNQTLHSNTCIIEWTFNFKYNRTTNPSGLAAGSFGTAIILATSNGVFAGTDAGNGYAIVYGNSGTPDPIRLVRFTGGLTGTITNIINSGINDISAVNNFASVRVRYEPQGDNWSLFIRDDGSTNWSNPSTGITNQKGSTTFDNTFTSIPLTHFGFYWSYATTAAQTCQFDNFRVTVAPTITVSTTLLPTFGTIFVGNSSSSQNFTISGSNLTGNIVITPPVSFEIRTGTNPFSTNPITLSQTSGTVENTTIDVRFSPCSIGSFSGSITCASTGAITKNITVSSVGAATGLDLYITRDSSFADDDHAVLFPHVGMGGGTIYSADDWTYNSPKLTFYVVPTGSQSIGVSEFEINWDTTKATLTVTNGNMFDFFAVQDISAGKKRINTGASANINESLSLGKYLVKLDFNIVKPGLNEITLTGIDFRYFVGEEQQNIQVTAHSGMIKFFLGDFASPTAITTTGDGKINFEDLVQFALAYFSESDRQPAGYKAKFDIGPTNSTGSYFALPKPDGQIQFEDLAIFSIGYGKTATLQLPKENTTPVLVSAQAPLVKKDGFVTVPLAISGNIKDVRALSISLTYPLPSLEYMGCEKSGELNQDYCFMAGKAKDNVVTLDAAVIGIEHDGLSKEGTFAYVNFKQRNQSKTYYINIQSAKARDSNNHDLQILISPNEILTSEVPSAFALSQNYPNPFNPSTVIEYQLPGLRTQYIVSLKVYDFLGREVAILLNKQQEAGYYRVEWNGKNIQQQPVSSGIYFYQICAVDPSSTSGNCFVNVRKMLLLK